MDYKLSIGDREVGIKVEPGDGPGRFEVVVEDAKHRVTAHWIDPTRLHLLVDGRASNLFTVSDEHGLWVWCDGRSRYVEDAKRGRRRGARTRGAASRDVTPPTPGSVTRVLVEVGQEVEEGQALVVVSAMKMEMTLKAPYGGLVRAVNTEVGAQVRPGEILVEIDGREEPSDEKA